MSTESAERKMDDILHTVQSGPEPPDPQRWARNRENEWTGPQPLPGYTLESKLGEGGFGVVWRATGPGGFPVAVKVVPADSKDSRSLELLRRIRHANIVAVHGAYFLRQWQVCPDELAADAVAIVMQLADGSLRDRFDALRAEGRTGIPLAELMGYMSEAAKALDYIARQQLTAGGRTGRYLQHGDIKPQNILLVGDAVALADFSLLQILAHTATAGPAEMSLPYAAPEVLVDKKITRYSDQFSLAVSFCFLLTGRFPFQRRGDDLAAVATEQPDLTLLPAEVRHVVARALRRSHTDRWDSCRAFVAQLAAVLGAFGHGGGPVAPPSDELTEYAGRVLREGKVVAECRQFVVVGPNEVRLHRTLFARESNLPETRDGPGGIKFVLVPPATTREGGRDVPHPAELAPGREAHFYISEAPVSAARCADLGASSDQEPDQWTGTDVSQWFAEVGGRLDPPVRLPTFAEWAHAVRLGLPPAAGVFKELCLHNAELHSAVVPWSHPVIGEPTSHAGRHVEEDIGWRLVLIAK